jgi:hypothetical protein
MDGMARALGGSATIKWNGKTYELPPLVMRDWATIENECLRRKRDAKIEAISALHGKIPDAVWEKRCDIVFKECETLSEIPAQEVQNWIDSNEGLVFTLWLSFEKKYPGEFSPEDMLEVITSQMTDEEVAKLVAARDQANGLDSAGNETGPAQE